MDEVVKKKKTYIEIDPIEKIHPIVKEEVILQEVIDQSNGMVIVPEGYIVNCRQKPEGTSGLITTLKSGDKCNFDGRHRLGDYIWIHDVKGYWIRSDQVECKTQDSLKEM